MTTVIYKEYGVTVILNSAERISWPGPHIFDFLLSVIRELQTVGERTSIALAWPTYLRDSVSVKPLVGAALTRGSFQSVITSAAAHDKMAHSVDMAPGEVSQ